jgi:hypothetical protein
MRGNSSTCARDERGAAPTMRDRSNLVEIAAVVIPAGMAGATFVPAGEPFVLQATPQRTGCSSRRVRL